MWRDRAGRPRVAALVVLATALLLALVAPTGASPAGGLPGVGPDSRALAGLTALEVASYNLYLGADLSPLFGVDDPRRLPEVAAGVWAEVQASAPAERMAAVARVLARERPDVVGLQEVALWEVAPYGVDPLTGLPQPSGPYQPTYDFLQLLLDALSARGTPYRAVAVQPNFTSAALPFAVPVSATEAVRFTDRDVLLVRERAVRRLAPSNPAGGAYEARFAVTVAGIPVQVLRGWISIDVSVRGRPFRVFNTHLEAFGTSPLRDEVRNPQAQELVAQVHASPHPVVVVGDLNARPTRCQGARRPPDPADANVEAYGIVQEAGLREVWALTHPFRPCRPAGWTSGQDDLRGPDTRTHRIDHIFIGPELVAARTRVVGDEAWERSEPSGLWPSDHAGVVATLLPHPRTRHHGGGARQLL